MCEMVLNNFLTSGYVRPLLEAGVDYVEVVLVHSGADEAGEENLSELGHLDAAGEVHLPGHGGDHLELLGGPSGLLLDVDSHLPAQGPG